MKIFEKKAKKGNLQSLIPAVITFVVVAVVLGIAATVLTTVQSTQTANTAAYNASAQGLSAIVTFSQYLPTLAIIVVLAIIISVIVYFMVGRFGKGGL